MPTQYYAIVQINNDPSANKVIYKDASQNPIPAISGRPGDQVQFSIQDLRTNPDPNGGDLVLIGQYSNPVSSPGNRTKRKTPFAGAALAVYIAQGGNDWTQRLTGPVSLATNFEYAAVALLDDGATVVTIDPSIIINPQSQ